MVCHGGLDDPPGRDLTHRTVCSLVAQSFRTDHIDVCNRILHTSSPTQAYLRVSAGCKHIVQKLHRGFTQVMYQIGLDTGAVAELCFLSQFRDTLFPRLWIPALATHLILGDPAISAKLAEGIDGSPFPTLLTIWRQHVPSAPHWDAMLVVLSLCCHHALSPTQSRIQIK